MSWENGVFLMAQLVTQKPEQLPKKTEKSAKSGRADPTTSRFALGWKKVPSVAAGRGSGW